MYQKVDTNLNFVDREKETLKFWQENDIFQKSMDNRKEGETYTFYDGPPTANGKPHIGHVLTRVIKDMIPRYRTMKGYMVPRKAGWDTHGLPVELEVEKLLGLDGKDHILQSVLFHPILIIFLLPILPEDHECPNLLFLEPCNPSWYGILDSYL